LTGFEKVTFEERSSEGETGGGMICELEDVGGEAVLDPFLRGFTKRFE